MVIGNGMIAQRFSSYSQREDVVIFASGVSNSKAQEESLFLREKLLLTETVLKNQDKHFIYFSTCSIFDPSQAKSRYVIHKAEMEDLIANFAPHFTIFRTSNVVGKTKNPNTVFNFYVHQIQAQQPFELWERATRNLIGIDDLFSLVDASIGGGWFQNEIVNAANPHSHSVLQIVNEIEAFLGQKANYKLTGKGEHFDIDTKAIEELIKELKIDFNNNYIKQLLEKYYS